MVGPIGEENGSMTILWSLDDHEVGREGAAVDGGEGDRVDCWAGVGESGTGVLLRPRVGESGTGVLLRRRVWESGTGGGRSFVIYVIITLLFS